MSNERPEFVCPISMAVMEDPVILAETGISYERSEITAWFAQGQNTCPCTGVTLQRQDVIPNRALKDAIANWNNNESNSEHLSTTQRHPSKQHKRRLGFKWISQCFKTETGHQKENPGRRVRPPSRAIASKITQAVHSNDLEALQALFEDGWNFNVLDVNGRGPLHVAVIDGNRSIVVQLLERFQMEVDLGDRSGCTGLHWAARLGHHGIAKTLVGSFKADVNSRNLMQMTPLHMASYWGKCQIAELLIQNGAEIDARNGKFEVALDVARNSPWEAAKEVVSILESATNQRRNAQRNSVASPSS